VVQGVLGARCKGRSWNSAASRPNQRMTIKCKAYADRPLVLLQQLQLAEQPSSIDLAGPPQPLSSPSASAREPRRGQVPSWPGHSAEPSVLHTHNPKFYPLVTTPPYHPILNGLPTHLTFALHRPCYSYCEACRYAASSAARRGPQLVHCCLLIAIPSRCSSSAAASATKWLPKPPPRGVFGRHIYSESEYKIYNTTTKSSLTE